MCKLILKYRSGEEIRKGDRILYFGNPAEIELVACDPGDKQADWYLEQYGGGIMILDPMASGRTFIPADQIDEEDHLDFVARAGV